jgi:hypothetical protein
VILYHRYQTDEEYGCIIHYGLFKSIEDMEKLQCKETEASFAEESKWSLVSDPDLSPKSIFIGTDIIESEDYPGVKEIVSVFKYMDGEVYYDDRYLIREIDTDKLEDGGEF